jgi:hypothetical protein
MGTKEGDAHGTALAQIERWAKDQGLRIVPAWVEPGEALATVHWEHEDGDRSWETYLTHAKAMGAPLVASAVDRLTQEDWDDEMEAAQGLVGDARAARLEELAECEPYIGHVMSIGLRWFSSSLPGVLFAWDDAVLWLDQFYRTEEDHPPRKLAVLPLSDAEIKTRDIAMRLLPEQVRASGFYYDVLNKADTLIKERLEKNPEVVHLADRLARDPRFQGATNAQMRRYAAEKVLGSDMLGHPTKLGFVIERARTIYATELRKRKGPAH